MANDDHTHGIGVLQGTALTLGALLGTGVISLPAIAVQKAGPASLVAWAALLICSVPLAATFTALGSRHPGGGGITTYARLALGDRVARGLGCAFYLTIPLGTPVAAGFGAAYVSDAFDRGRGTTLVVTGLIIVLVTAMNWFGIRLSAGAQLVIAGALVAVLSVTAIVAAPHAQADNLTPFSPHGLQGIGAAVAALVWAFAGWEIMASLSGEYAHPKRDIARAAAVTLVVVGVLYLAIAYTTVAVLGENPGKAPLSSLLVIGFGPAARPVMTVVALLLTIGTMNSYFAGASRLGAVLAAEGTLPRWLEERNGEPRRALALVGGLGLAGTLVMGIADIPSDRLLLVATGTFSVAYLIATIAAVRILERGWARLAAGFSVLVSVVLVVVTGWPVLGSVVLGVVGAFWPRKPLGPPTDVAMPIETAAVVLEDPVL